MSSITNINGTDLITDSRADINQNFTNLNNDKMETSVLDTDTTLAANSDAKVPTQKAVKAYVDAGGNVNATETTKGIVEIATDAEVAAGTTTGSTGAPLVMTPAAFAATTAPVVNVYEVGDSPATWTKPTGLKYVVVEVQGSGGGGGGADFDDTVGAGQGGAGGGYSKKTIVASALGATETVTIAAGGSGGASASSPSAGSAGGTSSFGIHATATGGAAGSAGGSNIAKAGGTGASGDVNISGSQSGMGFASDTTRYAMTVGGDSVLGRGGYGLVGTGTAGASGYGAGGGGGLEYSGSNFSAGGAGGDGVVIVTEYYV